LDEIAPVDDLKNLPGIVVRDENADSLFFEMADQPLHFLDGEGVDVGKRLIQKEERRVGEKGAADLQTAPFSSGEALRSAFSNGGKVQLFKALFEFFPPLFFPEGERFQNAEEIVLDSQRGKYRGLLSEVAEAHFRPFVDGKGGDFPVLKPDFSAVGRDEPNCHIKSGRLSRSVRAQKADDLSGGNRKAQLVYHGSSPIFFFEILRGKEGLNLRLK